MLCILSLEELEGNCSAMKEIIGYKTGEGCQGSSSTEVGINGEVSREIPLNKGPWTPAEDAILVDFVAKNGEGNWNAVHKVSRLRRCGKSCRLRWANHLRPDLKKGAFTPEEERLIIELHAKMGNKWARMAAEFPGRTDNEIKNFWNTRIKRLQRTGMPIYPLDVCLKVLHESRDGQNINLLQTTEMLCLNTIQTDSLNMPEVEFGDLEFNWDLKFFSHLHPPPSNMTKHWTIPSQSYYFNYLRMHLPGHLQESHTSFPGLKENNELLIGISPSSHAFLDGPYSSSSSVPTNGAMKLELPSFQYSDTRYPWGAPRSALPSFGSTDTSIHSPLTEKTTSNCVSPRSSGLLEAIVYESHTLKCTEKVRSQRNNDTLVLQSDAERSISRNSCEMEKEGHGDPNSPLTNSPVSVISDRTPGGKISSPYHSTVTHAGLLSDFEAGN